MTFPTLFPHRLAAPVLAAALLAVASPRAFGQVIDDVELVRDGADAVLRVRFAFPVVLKRSSQGEATPLLQVFYELGPGAEAPRFLAGERRRAGGRGLPELSIAEEPGNVDGERRLVVQVRPPATLHARAGRDPQVIELVLDGQGAAVDGAALPPAAKAVAVAPAAAASAGAVSGIAPPTTSTATLPPSGIGTPTTAELDARALELLARADEALARSQVSLAIENLNEALNLPPNAHTREIQERIGTARLRAEDVRGARAEFETFLKLYPTGPDAERVRLLLAGLQAPRAPGAPGTDNAAAPRPRPRGAGVDIDLMSGGLSQYFYGGNSRIQTRLMDTPLDGTLPQVVSESNLTGFDQKQLVNSADLNYRSRNVDRDIRFVFRDTYTVDFMPNRPDSHRPTAFYLDYKSFATGLGARVGRQSGQGGGVLGRFDGATLGWSFLPKWKLNGVIGQPSDKLLDSRRRFYGTSLDAEAITSNLGGSVYLIQQMIDGYVDRRAVGSDLRYVRPEVTAFTQFEYDLQFKAVNIASLQANWVGGDGRNLNLLLDHRATPMMMLGNALFFPDPAFITLPRTMAELIALKPLAELQQQVRDTTAYADQASLSATLPLNATWQWGADVHLTRVGAIAPVPGILPTGIPSTGNVWSAGTQLIGTHWWSDHDTHVLNASIVRGPGYSGWLANYNHMTLIEVNWRVEPSLRFYSQNGPSGVDTQRWSPGLRISWHGDPKWSLESDLNLEFSHTHSPTQNENSTRAYYSFGYRRDF